MTQNLRNWAGNYTYGAAWVQRPETVEEVCELVAQSPKVRALGTRHSFNEIADTEGDLLSTERLSGIVALDREGRRVTVEGGIKYGELCRYLSGEGFAIHNLASLPHISVAGACATATHGSGDRNGNLATAVSAIEIVRGDGTLVALSREGNPDEFEGAVVGLGALGVVVRVTLDVVPTFSMRQDVYEGLVLERVEESFDEITSSAYSVSLFTDWRSEAFTQVWIKARVEGEDAGPAEPTFYGATRATGPMHPIPGMSPVNCTEQMGVAGAWDERLPHFRMEFTPSSGEELQAEYLVPRAHAPAALRVIAGLRERIAPLLQISEVRTIAADNLWMSPCYGGACVGIHFTWKQDWEAVRDLLPVIEEGLAPFGARPHWGKLFTMSETRIQPLYERLPDFRRLAEAYDPTGKFRNAFLERCLLGSQD